MKNNGGPAFPLNAQLTGYKGTEEMRGIRYKKPGDGSPVNCTQCGRFVGRDGDFDVQYSEQFGDYIGEHPMCGKCRQSQK